MPLFQGGTIGLSTSLAFMMWVGLGGVISKTSVVVKPDISIEGCNWNISGFTTSAPPVTNTAQVISSTTSVYDKYT